MDCYMGMIFPVAFNYAPTGFLECDGSLLSVSQYQAMYALLGFTYGGSAPATFALPDLRGRMMLGSGTYQKTGPIYANGQSAGQPAANGQLTANVPIAVNNLPAHTHAATFAPVTAQTPVTIPATAGSGSITATATTAAVPSVDGHAVASPNPSTTYYLTGVETTGKNVVPVLGPFTTTAPTAGSSATVAGTTVAVNTSAYVPPTPQQTVNITTVTGGTVANANTGAGVPLAVSVPAQPYQVVNFIICMQGVFPQRP